MHVLEDDLEIQGKLTEYSTTGSSGKHIHRYFCGTWGSLLFGKLDLIPGHRNISASSLDNPSQFVPQVDIWIKEVQPWDCLNPLLKKYEENPI